MIRDDRATFSIYGGRRSVAEISDLLGMLPSRSHDVGDEKPVPPPGSRLRQQSPHHQRTFWSVSVRSDVDNVDERDKTGLAALSALVALLVPRGGAIAEVQKDAETVLWWSGDSDSAQGGFVLTADLIGQLAILGCDVYGTAYLHDDDGDAYDDETEKQRSSVHASLRSEQKARTRAAGDADVAPLG